MTTTIATPAGQGARPVGAGKLLGIPARTRRQRLTVCAVAASALVVGSLLVTTDLRARNEIGADSTSLATAVHQLSGLQARLVLVERQEAVAGARATALTRAFDVAQAGLSATQAALAQAESGIHVQGVDLGVLDTCLGDVEQALNQLAVGQTAGGLQTLRGSSSSCGALKAVG